MEVYVKVAFNRYYFFVTKTIFKRQADFATNPQPPPPHIPPTPPTSPPTPIARNNLKIKGTVSGKILPGAL